MFNYTTGPDLSQPLLDISRTGRIQPWAQHRAETELLAWCYEARGDNQKAKRLRGCSPRLLYSIEQRADGTERLKLRTAWFCRVRLCPVCQWRRSLKIYGQAVQIIRATQQQRPRTAWIMLTLTVRNVDGWDLPAALDDMTAAWHRLLKTKDWQQIALGALRATEVTHNLKPDGSSYDTYHPHYHVLIAVDERYFHSRHYLSREKWAQLWQDCARLEYKPQVWVSRVRGTSEAALAEVAKYATKPAEYIIPDDLDMMQQTIYVLDKALHKRRLMAWSGLLKQVHHDLHLDDAETGDLIHISDDDDTQDGTAVSYTWVPGRKQYYKDLDPAIYIDRGVSICRVMQQKRILQGAQRNT
uniref:Replication protein n=1 Tax=uncultured prokaryote TaxID=198431 RepID=A0A0H5Q4Y6_9ZZZZ|nr:hypothetical protein [uncultured prokaryote]